MDKTQANKTIAYWLESADYDMGVAESLLEKEKFHYALFFGHLCLEKLLKALYVKTTSDHAPVTHSLPLLAQKAGLDIPEARMEKLAEFMEFYLEGRYPRDWELIRKKFDLTYTREKLQEIKETAQWLKTKL